MNRMKVIKGLEAHEKGCGYRSHHCDDMDCPYRYGDESCDIEEMCHDALVLLKEQDNCENCAIAIEDRQMVVRCKDCEYSYIEGFVNERLLCEKHPELGVLNNDWFCADGWKA